MSKYWYHEKGGITIGRINSDQTVLKKEKKFLLKNFYNKFSNKISIIGKL